MSSLNEITSDFEIDILFTQLWHDKALSFTHLPACKRYNFPFIKLVKVTIFFQKYHNGSKNAPENLVTQYVFN